MEMEMEMNRDWQNKARKIPGSMPGPTQERDAIRGPLKHPQAIPDWPNSGSSTPVLNHRRHVLSVYYIDGRVPCTFSSFYALCIENFFI